MLQLDILLLPLAANHKFINSNVTTWNVIVTSYNTQQSLNSNVTTWNVIVTSCNTKQSLNSNVTTWHFIVATWNVILPLAVIHKFLNCNVAIYTVTLTSFRLSTNFFVGISLVHCYNTSCSSSLLSLWLWYMIHPISPSQSYLQCMERCGC